MKTYFRLYNSEDKTKIESSLFDLISGDKETKQTKGLAYVLAKNQYFLNKLIKYVVKRNVPELISKINKASSIIVEAERILTDGKRADVLIRIKVEDKPFLAILIEAKSISANHNARAIDAQIIHYLKNEKDNILKGYQCVGVLLTKYIKLSRDKNILNISWSQIINLCLEDKKLFNKDIVLKQYIDFLINGEKSMKFYEEEVLSIPAGKTIDLIKKHHIYVCPNSNDYSYKDALFMAFRASGGGQMEKLYKVDETIILNLSDTLQELENFDLDVAIIERIRCYVNDHFVIHEKDGRIKVDEMRVYILSQHETIDLPLNPRPEKSNSKHTYYTLKEMLTMEILPAKSLLKKKV